MTWNITPRTASRPWTTAACIAVACSCAPTASGQDRVPSDAFSFVVLGHPKGAHSGEFDAQLDEAVDRVASLNADLLLITGDLIEGDYFDPATRSKKVADRSIIDADWDSLDARFDRLGIPVHRLPGNHDVHCTVSRAGWLERYGPVPRAFTHQRSRFVLLDSVGVANVDDEPAEYAEYEAWSRGTQLDAEQVAFLHEQLADVDAFDHAFVFVHHALWRDRSSAWWIDVHPKLKAGRVRAVFSGDLAGFRYTHDVADGVHYVQAALFDARPESIPLGGVEDVRMRVQPDTIQFVRVAGDDVHIEPIMLGHSNSPGLTFKYWSAVAEAGRPKNRPLWERIYGRLQGPRRLVLALAVSSAFGLIVGIVVCSIRTRRRAGRNPA